MGNPPLFSLYAHNFDWPIQKVIRKNQHFKRYFEILESIFPKEVIPEKHFVSFKESIQSLPLSSTSCFGFECHLQKGKPRADFAMPLDPAINPGDKAVLVSLGKKISNGISELGRSWLTPDSILYKNIKEIWLEFDNTGNISSWRVPCVFFNIKPLFSNKKDLYKKIERVCDCAISSLIGARIDIKDTYKTVKRCVNALPDSASIDYIGVMTSRDPFFIRIVVKIPPAHIINYLTDIGWQGDKEIITGLLESIKDITNYINVTINARDCIEQKIGFECYQNSLSLGNKPDWTAFFNYLIKNELCNAVKTKALDNYFGHTLVENNKGDINNQHNIIQWGINHMKIVYSGDRQIQAKAYLYLMNMGIELDDRAVRNN